jgi:aryl-alcohol dehydrogenase-like predicted oxidoreductase
MKYNNLGKTGMKLSNVGLGCSSLGGVFHSFKEPLGIETVFKAVESGINYLDVSPYYGYYKAELVLGKALKDIDHSKFYLSTKVGRYGEDGHNTWDYSAERVTRSVFESMERLHVDYIDLIFVHDIEFADLHQVVDETLPALHELKRQGVVKHVGCTDLQLPNLQWVVEHSAPGTIEAVMSFCHYCLNDDLLSEYLDLFERNGIGVINASPFAMGLLTQRGVPDWHPAPKPLVAACKRAADYCTEKGYPIEKLAMQFSTSNPRITSTIFSTTNPANLAKNLAYVDEPMDQQLVDEVRDIIGDQKRVTWANT